MKSLRNFSPLLLAVLLVSGCAFGDFTPYSGQRQQQNWPTQPGSFVSTKYVIPAYIHSWPDRPYTDLGYLDATTAPIRRHGAVSFAARRAKEFGADAIIVMEIIPAHPALESPLNIARELNQGRPSNCRNGSA